MISKMIYIRNDLYQKKTTQNQRARSNSYNLGKKKTLIKKDKKWWISPVTILQYDIISNHFTDIGTSWNYVSFTYLTVGICITNLTSTCVPVDTIYTTSIIHAGIGCTFVYVWNWVVINFKSKSIYLISLKFNKLTGLFLKTCWMWL